MKTMIALLAIVLTSAATTAEPGFTTLISHRGESHDAPENTFPAFKLAVDRGFGFECDVYLSKDKRVFTFHDGNLKRTTGGANTNSCSAVTWDELSSLDVGNWGRWKGSSFKGTRPALLEEVLTLARDGRKIYVEIKPGPEIVQYVKKVFEKQTLADPGNTLFISFNAETCKELKKLMPEYKVYWLVGAARRPTAEFVLSRLRSIGADGVDIQFSRSVVTEDFIKTVRAAGYEVHVWTVDKLQDTLEAFRRGAMTVTTNCARKQHEEWKKASK